MSTMPPGECELPAHLPSIRGVVVGGRGLIVYATLYLRRGLSWRVAVTFSSIAGRELCSKATGLAGTSLPHTILQLHRPVDSTRTEAVDTEGATA